MLMRLRSVGMIKVIVALAVASVAPAAAWGVTITINSDVATGPITDGSGIIVDGWVKGARTYQANPETKQMELVSTNANKVKIYLFYQQQRTDPGATARYQLDATAGTLGSSSGDPDSSYSGNVTANMPDKGATTVTEHCWFLRCEALMDTSQNPDQLVASVEKDVNLVWTSP